MNLEDGVRHAGNEVKVGNGLTGTHFSMNTEEPLVPDRKVMEFLTEIVSRN